MPATTPSSIDASPTKAFFIEMLTRDIDLIPAIIDLVDNSMDGARRLRGSKSYAGLSIRLHVSADRFSISDNCGGIELDVATKYAFRFGRPAGATQTKHSIGQFGVGMKRALFKLGTGFIVESTAARSQFRLEVNVPQWSTEPGWTLPLKVAKRTALVPASKRGTVITAKPLHPRIGADFSLPTFLSDLREELQRAHQYSMEKGLAITLNGTPLHVDLGTLLASNDLRPAMRELSMNGTGATVDVKLYCGVASSSPRDAGWYVFCNGRMVLEADQTAVTGWGARNGQAVPAYHNQFATFRGYVFFESDDAGRLPWNTTKTGVDSESEIFRHVRREMLAVMRPVIDFLNKLDAEKDVEEEEGPGPLTLALTAARSVPLTQAHPNPTFLAPAPKPKKKPAPKTSSIQYRRPVAAITVAKRTLGVATNYEVGERTFDYYYELECSDE